MALSEWREYYQCPGTMKSLNLAYKHYKTYLSNARYSIVPKRMGRSHWMNLVWNSQGHNVDSWVRTYNYFVSSWDI